MKAWKRKEQNLKFKKCKVSRGDKVKIIAGKEINKTGTVLRVLRKKGRVVVEKLNIVKRHSRGTSAQNPGGIVEKEAPIHISNVKVLEKKAKESTKKSSKGTKKK